MRLGILPARAHHARVAPRLRRAHSPLTRPAPASPSPPPPLSPAPAPSPLPTAARAPPPYPRPVIACRARALSCLCPARRPPPLLLSTATSAAAAAAAATTATSLPLRRPHLLPPPAPLSSATLSLSSTLLLRHPPPPPPPPPPAFPPHPPAAAPSQDAPRLTLAQTIVAVEEGDLTAWRILLRYDTKMIDVTSGFHDSFLEHFLIHCLKFYPKHEDFLAAYKDIIRANKARAAHPPPPSPPSPAEPQLFYRKRVGRPSSGPSPGTTSSRLRSFLHLSSLLALTAILLLLSGPRPRGVRFGRQARRAPLPRR